MPNHLDEDLESDIEKPVCDWAVAKGWLALKLNIVGQRGYPDRLFVGPEGQHVWIEFKRNTRTGPTKLQAYRISELRKRKADAFWAGSITSAKTLIDPYWDHTGE